MEMMCEADPSYRRFVAIENGRKISYLKLRTALYGMVQTALLWYETFSTCLRVDSFKLN